MISHSLVRWVLRFSVLVPLAACGVSDDNDSSSCATTFYADSDDDGYGSAFPTATGCSMPGGFGRRPTTATT